MPRAPKFQNLAMLRCAILLMGERCRTPWWNSTAASKDAADFRFVFPRTPMTAAFHRASALAKSLHDQRTKKIGVFHLFRLPHGIEIELHRLLTAAETSGELKSERIDQFFKDSLGPNPTEEPAVEGPVDCGKITLSRPSDLRKIGSLYQKASAANIFCLPYFQLTE